MKAVGHVGRYVLSRRCLWRCFSAMKAASHVYVEMCLLVSDDAETCCFGKTSLCLRISRCALSQCPRAPRGPRSRTQHEPHCDPQKGNKKRQLIGGPDCRTQNEPHCDPQQGNKKTQPTVGGRFWCPLFGPSGGPRIGTHMLEPALPDDFAPMAFGVLLS